MTIGRARYGAWWLAGLALAACEARASCGQDAAAAPDLGAPTEDAARDDAPPPLALVVLDHEAIDLGIGCFEWPSTRATLQLASASATRIDVSATLVGAMADQLHVDLSTCSGGLAPGAFCAIGVDTAFTSLGPVSVDLVVVAGPARWTVPIAGTVANCDAAPLAPSFFSFGTVSVGARSTPQVFSIPNAGGELLPPFTGATLGGLDADQFEIVRDGCTGHALVPGASCDVDVVLAPTRVGAFSATLDLAGYVGSTSSLTGSAVAP